MRKIVGRLLVVVGAILLAGAVGLLAFDLWGDFRASSQAGEALAAVDEATEANRAALSDNISGEGESEVVYEGRGYFATLDIPALGLRLPIIYQWDFAALQQAPCRYSGSVQQDDLVIAAHNYNSHFGRLGTLSLGDQVVLTDLSGTSVRYRVASIEEMPPTAVEQMTAGDYDLTLFTCNFSGQARTTVRCDRA